MRQHIARLRVRGRDGELPLLAVAELLAEPLDVRGVDQDALDDLDQLLAGVGQAEQPLAAAHEQLDAELVLEILDVLLTPDCEVNSAFATSVRLKFRRTVSRTMRSCWKFIALGSIILLLFMSASEPTQTNPNSTAPTEPERQGGHDASQIGGSIDAGRDPRVLDLDGDTGLAQKNRPPRLPVGALFLGATVGWSQIGTDPACKQVAGEAEYVLFRCALVAVPASTTTPPATVAPVMGSTSTKLPSRWMIRVSVYRRGPA